MFPSYLLIFLITSVFIFKFFLLIYFFIAKNLVNNLDLDRDLPNLLPSELGVEKNSALGQKILNEIKEGKFSKGEHIFGIKENGVGIPKENPNLSEEAKSKIAKAIEELKSGKVEVVATGDELKAKGSATNIEGEL